MGVSIIADCLNRKYDDGEEEGRWRRREVEAMTKRKRNAGKLRFLQCQCGLWLALGKSKKKQESKDNHLLSMLCLFEFVRI